MILWTSDDICKATGGRCAHSLNMSGVSIDTRTLAPGDLFVALKGENSDGHVHVQDALQKGAGGALVSFIPEGLSESDPLMIVPDTLAALQAMSTFARDRAIHAKRIGVTGSVGKTGTKEMLKLVLSDQGRTTASAASYNNHWGVPLTLSRMPQDTEFGVFEMGMNAPGEIRALTKMVAPHVAIITTVAESHAAFFKSFRDIVDAKAEIFEGVVPEGAAILYRDHPFYEALYEKAKSADVKNIYSFGEHAESDCRLLSYTQLDQESLIEVSLKGTKISYVLPIPGQHWVMNSLAVLLAVYCVGGDALASAQSLLKITPPPGRGTRHEIQSLKGKFLLIDESYNANPASMQAAIAVLGSTSPQGHGRRVAVIGDMRELGDIADTRHAALKDPVLEARIDQVYCCGPHMKKLAEALPPEILAQHQEISTQLIEPLINSLKEGDVVMVKGSFGTRMAPIVAALKSLDQSDLREEE